MKITEAQKITVAIRKRPLNKKELQRCETDIVRVGNNGQVTVSEYKQKVDLTKYLEETTFNFDFAYNENSSNEEIYEQSIHPLIQNAFMGAKISCFAYGQTGSGKTHTMKGDINQNIPGLYYLGAQQIFQLIEQPQFRHLHVTVSFYEIYCGRLHDLLNNRAELKIREDKKQNINVIGLEQKLICSAGQFMNYIEYGSTFRVTSQNATNADSSRSHAILQITLKHQKKSFSKISFIDLAGNERGADHMDQNKQTKIDGAQINKSLLSLKECIRALDQDKGHVPFRGSKLTMVLKDSFVGFCNTVMICNVSPNVTASENTMNTLRYADRVKELKRDQSNSHFSKEEQMARELMLPRANNKNCIKVNIQNNDDDEDIMLKMENARQMHQNNNFGRKQFEEEKMDIQEPYENRRTPQVLNFGRKSQNITCEIKGFNATEKRVVGLASKEMKPLKQAGNDVCYRGRDLAMENEKQPLLSRNVLKPMIDQNNLNFGNSNCMSHEFDANNRRKQPFPSTSLTTNINRSQFEAMNNLRNGFQQYRQDHETLIKQQMVLIKDQMLIKNDYRKMNEMGNNYEEEIQDVNNYLDKMEQCINQKLELFNMMKNNIEKMRNTVKNAQDLTSNLRAQQQNQTSAQMHNQTQMPNQNYRPLELNMFKNHNMNGIGNGLSGNLRGLGGIGGCQSQTKLHVHSSMNSINFNGFNNFNNHYGDQQLLQGLPGDQSMSRLF